MTDKITELAEGISNDENDDLQYLPPLKVLNVLAEHLTSNSPGKPAPVLINKSSQTSQGKEVDLFCQTNLNLVNFLFQFPRHSSLRSLKLTKKMKLLNAKTVRAR